jgi:hypothetical protein
VANNKREVDLSDDFRITDKWRNLGAFDSQREGGSLTEELMVAIVWRGRSRTGGTTGEGHGIVEQTIYAWRKRFGSFG